MASDLVNSIIAAEETAREINEGNRRLLKKFKTNVIDWKDFVVDPSDGSYEFLNLSKKGRIEELVIISPTSEFSITVTVDGTLTYQGDFARFQEITTHVGSIVAKQRGPNLYVLQFIDVRFDSSILVMISVTSKTTFNRLYCKYETEMQEK